MTTNDLAEAIAITLDSERRAAGWTNLEALAKEIGLSEQTLQRYLTRRERSIPAEVLVQICHVIGVPLSVIVTAAERRVATPPTGPPATSDTA